MAAKKIMQTLSEADQFKNIGNYELSITNSMLEIIKIRQYNIL